MSITITAGTIKNTVLPVYADNASAISGGLTVGDLYRTPVGAVRVVI